MKLLLVTQKVDIDDPILGFFHRWIKEFAKHAESVTVICLYEGAHNLPENVKVLSLGKEGGVSRLTYILRFYKYIWSNRKEYDSIFVHMNQEYVLLGGLLWRLLGKKIMLWRNHAKGSVLTQLAILFSHKVFCTSSESFTARFKKTTLMPVGIDTNFFKPDSSIQKKPNSILFLGRISPVKNVDIFVEALKGLRYKKIEFYVTIAGGSSNRDAEYEKMIRGRVSEYNLDDKVKFTGFVSKVEALKLYKEHALYVNLTPPGSMDKTIFEAMAAGLDIVASNDDLSSIIGENLVDKNDGQNVAIKMESALLKKKNSFRKYVVKEHGIEYLVKSIIMNS